MARLYHSGGGWRKTCALGLALLLPGADAHAAARGVVPACAPEGGESVEVTAVASDFSLTLKDGRSLRLAGIDPVAPTSEHPAFADDTRSRVAAWLVGHEATMVPLGEGVDRWGRMGALVFAAGGAPSDAPGTPLSVALALVDAGLARGRPEAGFAACWPALRQAEQAARESGLGLWGDPYYAVLESGEPMAGADRAGTMVIVEGTVSRVGQGRSRLFIGLGRGEAAVEVSIARRDLFMLGQSGLDDNQLVGSVLRVRGDLDDRDGPSIDVTDGAQIEVVGRGPAGSPSTGR